MSSQLRAALACACLLAAVFALGAGTRPVVASAPPGTSCQVFPADNVWNTDISTLPVNANSAAWLNSSGASSGTRLHPDFGGPPYGIPFNVVNNTHAVANFDFLYWQESDPAVSTKQPQGPYPYGSDLQVEGPTDSHMLTINSDTCKLYETFATDYNGPHTAGSGAIFDLGSDALRPDGWTSADAAGLPIFPGLVRLDEVQSGAITHAIRFTVQKTDTSHLWPARHDAGSASNPSLPPMGARFRLKASFDISGFNAPAQVVLTAMKHYGLILADNGSNWYFQGTEDSGWNNEPYATMVSQLKTVPASAFEAVDESSLMINPDSGQAVAPCTSAGLSPASPTGPAGSTIGFTATSTGCVTPEYEFWVQYPDGSWNLKQAFGGPNFSWDTTGLPPGVYTVHAWVNAKGAGHDAIGAAAVTLTGCSAASLTPAVTQPAGSIVAMTAVASCLNPRYEFWVQYPGGSWNLKQGWGGPAFNWDTGGLAPGVYTVHAWVNTQGAGHDAIGSATVTLTGCTGATVSPSSTVQPIGSFIAFSAGSTGCPNPVYEFWVLYPDGSWNLKQGFGGPAFNWDTTGLSPGIYTVHAWANQQGAASTLEAYGSATVTLTGCTSASLSPPSPSASAGSTVVLTAGSTGCLLPRYEFWVLYPDGSWNLKQGWGGPSFSWNTAGLAPGVYTVHDWVNRSGTGWEAYGSSTVSLTGCSSATLIPSSGSAAAGSTLTFTAGSAGCPNPVYEFWLLDPSRLWHLVQSFGAGSWTWNSAGWPRGAYTIHVWANQQGADSSRYETIGSATFTLS